MANEMNFNGPPDVAISSLDFSVNVDAPRTVKSTASCANGGICWKWGTLISTNPHSSISVDECLLVFLIQDVGHSVFCTTIVWLSPWHGE
ncbi:hypothetical protein SV7mr_23070 [Stieleria bergensis]|uniref:Uncharacterized protein n=1 Tax=Stieleria bergensis TaxID=2528025 RepID=A0A517SUJ5_9BACT|nr:hypothetical protein SV7mr_23070 [Planctomycetes bacterium SV_7m_r]